MTKRTRSDPTSDAVPTATAIMPTDSDATSDAVLAEPALIPTGSDAKKVTVAVPVAAAEGKALLMPPSVPENKPPSSPASNRDRFRASCMPAQISCELSTVSSEPGLRFSFQAIVLVVYPASQSPIRRHVLLGDGRGTVGVTVWNSHVNAFSFSVIGQMVQLTKVSLSVYNGTRSIAMNKESTVTFSDGNGHFAHTWWSTIPMQQPLSAMHISESNDNAIVNVAGVLGAVHVESRTVRSDARELLTLRIVDRTGIINVRSWNHSAAMFQPKQDQPILISRVRVTSFGGMKVCELLDGNGSIVHEGDFPAAADLAKFWSE